MNPEHPSVLTNILVGIDFSDVGALALDHALRLASERATARLHVAHVAQLVGEDAELDLPEGPRTLSIKDAVKWLDELVERARVAAMTEGEPIESERVSVHIRIGDAEEELKELADKLAVDLLVVGTHGKGGFRRLVLGSVAESLLRNASCSVLVVRPTSETGARRETTP